MNLRVAVATTAALGLAFAGLAVPADAAPKVFVLYMAPGGTGDGSKSKPLGSLAKAQSVIRTAKPKTNVEIRIRPGTYRVEPKTIWKTYLYRHYISFMAAGGARPVFVNASKTKGPWFVAKKNLPHDAKVDLGRLRFLHLEVRGFQGGIALDGDAPDVPKAPHPDSKFTQNGAGLNHNIVEDVIFRNIGNLRTGLAASDYGYGALILTNSSDNQILRNKFIGVENKAPHGPKIHGVYVTHFSSVNKIRGNRFTDISGDPVKVRDRSNTNTITGNTFTNAGHYSYYREEFCVGECLKKHKDKPQECASGDNTFKGNTRNSGYKGKRIPDVTLEPKSKTAKGPAWCPPLAGGPGKKARVRT